MLPRSLKLVLAMGTIYIDEMRKEAADCRPGLRQQWLMPKREAGQKPETTNVENEVKTNKPTNPAQWRIVPLYYSMDGQITSLIEK